MADQMRRLSSVGQSIWLDNIRRSMFASGELTKLIDNGLRGMTSNPTIFEKSIGSGNDYDEQLKSLVGKEHDPNRLFEALAIDDIRNALDAFRPLYESSDGSDGFVSLEVSPLLAHDTKGTIDAAKRLWKAVDRPNLMIKIPGTPECLESIQETIAAGINVNVTLLFSIDRYELAANAYITGLEKRMKRNEPIDRVASVASFFISRIDTAVDKLLEAKIAKGEAHEPLLGKAGIANAKLAYVKYKDLFESDRFAKLQTKGAMVQRPLWASTGTKNPKYSDLLYIETLVGKNTVNTVPPATLTALLDHGTVTADTIESDIADAQQTFDALGKAQISMFDITEDLQTDGVKSFAESYNAMLEAIEYKQKALISGTNERVMLSLGSAQAAADTALTALEANNFLSRLWKKDASLWSAEPNHAAIIKNALGWLNISFRLSEVVDDLTLFAKQCAKEYKHVIVLGMGGSSLAPDVLRATFGQIAGFPKLHVLDSSDPVQVKALDDSLDLATSLFIVASKSGTTTEPDAFYRYFFDRVSKTVGTETASKHFIAITDPDTKLAHEAEANGFLRVFINAADIGGRYSALSYFGMVPAALAGYDVRSILDRAMGGVTANASTASTGAAPGVIFGAALGSLAKSGRDKLTIVTHPKIGAFGAWAEQLVAESTGKSGTGIIPVEGETLGAPANYGTDRVFVYVGQSLGGDEGTETKLKALEGAGHPVIRLQMTDLLDIGEQFYTWEIATATAGSIMGIDAFDQPNVQESKDNTKRLLEDYAGSGAFREAEPNLTAGQIAITTLKGSDSVPFGNSLESALGAIFSQIRPGDYVAFNAYVPMNAVHQQMLHDLRLKVRDAFKVATTVGFGPRFLHSTGQLHKGGPASGVYLQMTYDAPADLLIPGMGGFRTLERAQALGDFESLDGRGRRGARLNITGDLDAGLRNIAAAIDDAVAAKA